MITLAILLGILFLIVSLISISRTYKKRFSKNLVLTGTTLGLFAAYFFILAGTYSAFRWEAGVVFERGCNIRSAPSTQSEKIGFASPVHRYIVDEKEGNWSRVLLINGEYGWVGCPYKKISRAQLSDPDYPASQDELPIQPCKPFSGADSFALLKPFMATLETSPPNPGGPGTQPGIMSRLEDQFDGVQEGMQRNLLLFVVFAAAISDSVFLGPVCCQTPALITFQASDASSGMAIFGFLVGAYCLYVNKRQANLGWALLQTLIQTAFIAVLSALILAFLFLLFARSDGKRMSKKKAAGG